MTSLHIPHSDYMEVLPPRPTVPWQPDPPMANVFALMPETYAPREVPRECVKVAQKAQRYREQASPNIAVVSDFPQYEGPKAQSKRKSHNGSKKRFTRRDPLDLDWSKPRYHGKLFQWWTA